MPNPCRWGVSDDIDTKPMKQINPSWQAHIVLLCSMSRPEGAPKPSCGHHGAEELRGWLKAELQQRGLWGRVRVVTASCLDVCPQEGVTLSFQGKSGAGDTFVFDAQEERGALLERIIERTEG